MLRLPSCCCGSVVAVVALDAAEAQCVRAYSVYVRTVCTGGHRFTREFVVGVVAAVEIHVRACIMCRPWTQICRLFVGSATIINIIHKSTCVRVCVCLCVKCLFLIAHSVQDSVYLISCEHLAAL